MGSKPSKPMPVMPTTNLQRMDEGRRFLAIVWQSVAAKVVERAIQIYKLNPKQADALRIAFLQRVSYDVIAT